MKRRRNDGSKCPFMSIMMRYARVGDMLGLYGRTAVRASYTSAIFTIIVAPEGGPPRMVLG